jgi:hypothetical protein
LITAATGVFVIPAVPYLQAIGFEKDELVQALGLSFTVSTIALAFNVAFEGGLNLSVANDTLSPATFRRWFFASLSLLGVYLAVRSVL